MQFSKKKVQILGRLPIEQFQSENGVIETQAVFFRETTKIEGKEDFVTDFVGYLNESCLNWIEKDGNEKLFDIVNEGKDGIVEISGYAKSKSKDFEGKPIFNTRFTVTFIAFPSEQKTVGGQKKTRAQQRAEQKRQSPLYKASEAAKSEGSKDDLPF